MRVPASFCGLHGIRPTHGRLDLTGMLPQAPSSDTTGWFARDAQTFARVSRGDARRADRRPTLPTRLVVAVDAFGLADAETAARAPADGAPALGAWWGTCARICSRRPASRSGRGRSARCSRGRRGSPSRSGSTATTRGWPSSVARNLALAAAIPESERQWAALMRGEARARLAVAPAARHDPLPADDAVPRAAQGPAARDARAAARAHHVPGRARRPHRRAAGEPARRERRRPAGRPVHRRRARQRRHAGGGGAGPGGRR